MREIAEGYRHIALEDCASTNTVCQDIAHEGDPGNLWVTSRTQTAARGSRQRNWFCEPGNLYSSLLLVEPCQLSHLPELTFVTALAVRKTVSEFLTEAEICVKWPNDVLANGLKISGILLESTNVAGKTIVIIGIGTNCQSYPDQTMFPATSIRAQGCEVKPEAVFGVLVKNMVFYLEVWRQGSGFDAIRDEWLQHAWGLGKEIRVGLPNANEEKGVFSGMTEQGQMILTSHSGSQNIISVGDVFGLPKHN